MGNIHPKLSEHQMNILSTMVSDARNVNEVKSIFLNIPFYIYRNHRDFTRHKDKHSIAVYVEGDTIKQATTR
jgi:hypothetical protein